MSRTVAAGTRKRPVGAKAGIRVDARADNLPAGLPIGASGNSSPPHGREQRHGPGVEVTAPSDGLPGLACDTAPPPVFFAQQQFPVQADSHLHAWPRVAWPLGASSDDASARFATAPSQSTLQSAMSTLCVRLVRRWRAKRFTGGVRRGPVGLPFGASADRRVCLSCPRLLEGVFHSGTVSLHPFGKIFGHAGALVKSGQSKRSLLRYRHICALIHCQNQRGDATIVFAQPVESGRYGRRVIQRGG